MDCVSCSEKASNEVVNVRSGGAYRPLCLYLDRLELVEQ